MADWKSNLDDFFEKKMRTTLRSLVSWPKERRSSLYSSARLSCLLRMN
jgi:hypothetical protein